MPGIVAADHVNFTDSHGRKWSYPLARRGYTLTSNASPVKWSWDGSAPNNMEIDGRSALQLCEALGSGWRLPTKTELKQARDDNATATAVYSGEYRWSSTESNGPVYADIVKWTDGHVSGYGKNGQALVSCVK